MKCRRCNAHDRVVPDQDEKLVLCAPHLWELAKKLAEELRLARFKEGSNA